MVKVEERERERGNVAAEFTISGERIEALSLLETRRGTVPLISNLPSQFHLPALPLSLSVERYSYI